MLARYTMNFEDFKHAQILCYRRKKFGALRMAIWVWVLPVLGLVCAAILAWDITARHFAFTPLAGGVLAALTGFGLFVLVMRPVNVRRLYKQMKNGRPENEPVELEIEGDEMISRLPGLSEGRFRRAAVVDFAEDDHIALLFVAKNKFLLVPKRALNESQWAAVHAWLDTSKVNI
ncbi:hypothetical protein Terro_3629 [Terriglobus roseus DSM 18391]|uniref:YcxB-like protein n=1 Tax=Terriglobus roseus (strain DSM 18391 / NRRL B-41598 / KBS 63) TaxID=926566 RepID=I3ZKS5_TERRK|nr:hypothetical protein [Terriglobus roseus]AFL89843.1 hypothetical protein Terro_3629 [Terriglobus roseus DSM 18391]